MTVGRPGDLAWLDSFAGLVPVRVTDVSTDAGVVAVVTAARPGFTRGEVVQAPPHRVVPRAHVRTRSGSHRVVGQWRWSSPSPVDSGGPTCDGASGADRTHTDSTEVKPDR